MVPVVSLNYGQASILTPSDFSFRATESWQKELRARK